MSFRDIDKDKPVELRDIHIAQAAGMLGVPKGQRSLFVRYFPEYLAFFDAKAPSKVGQVEEPGKWKLDEPQRPTEETSTLNGILTVFEKSGFPQSFLKRLVEKIGYLEEMERRRDRGEYLEEMPDIAEKHQVSTEYAGIAFDNTSWD